ncbi:MAG: hypothetical protein V7739_09070 [Motiliproteus sp.]
MTIDPIDGVRRTLPMNELERLIKQRSNALGFTRSQLVTQLGYKSISGGLRKLDTFGATLKAPAGFELLVQQTLDIPDVDYHAAITAVETKQTMEWREQFRPKIQFTLLQRPSPLFLVGLVPGLFGFSVPVELSAMAKQGEIEKVVDLYQAYVDSKSVYPHCGFSYYRNCGQCWEFDEHAQLVSETNEDAHPAQAWLRV